MYSVQKLQQARPFAGTAITVTRSSSTNFTTALRTNNRRSTTIRAAAADDDDVGIAGTAAIALGLAANPIVLWSEYTLATTGAGLQGDILGAAEGVSYLVVLGLVGWSLKTKVSTGSGLPAGPSGLLGAAEGFSYLSLLGGIIAFGLKAANISF